MCLHACEIVSAWLHMRVMGVGMQDGQQPVNWTVATHINPTPRVIEDLKLARQKRCSLPSPPPRLPPYNELLPGWRADPHAAPVLHIIQVIWQVLLVPGVHHIIIPG